MQGSTDFMNHSISRRIPDNVRAPSLSLHAATLSRLGRDRQAVATYDAALKLKQYLSADSIQVVCMGKGYALQRLMRYDEARDQFLGALDQSAALENFKSAARASVSAATCSLRLKDLLGATDALERYIELHFLEMGGKTISFLDAEVAGLYGYLVHVQSGSERALEYESKAFKFIEHAARTSSLPLYRWLLCITSENARKPLLTAKYSLNMLHSFLEMAAINLCSLDDSRLIHLDDKVLLQQLMSLNNRPTDVPKEEYWPDGFILPDESDRLKEYSEKHSSAKWMIKERAGYGSHGNYVAPTMKQVLKHIQAGDGEQVLCQRIVEPPLLINGRKFSMRVYVIILNGPRNESSSNGAVDSCNLIDAYLCTNGLAKLALASYEEGVYDMENIDDAFMTNSGRKEANLLNQFDFEQLRAEFENRGLDYDKMWKRVAGAVCSTLERFRDTMETKKITRSDLSASLCLPKILGFDFLLDGDIMPKLIEINRFPGLEPRSSDDEAVKLKVVEDAWRLACDSENIPHSFLDLKDKKEEKESLQKLKLY